MRFSNRLVGLRRPDWKKLSTAFVWLVFVWNFVGLPLLHQAKDPQSRMHDPIVSPEYYQASMDTAFAMQALAKSLGTDYRATQYAEDIFWLLAREDQVRHWLAGSSPFTNIVTYLNERAIQSEEYHFVAKCRENGQSENMCRRMAQLEGRRTVGEIVEASRRSKPGFELMSGQDILGWLKRSLWHFSRSNLWTMLATMLMLLMRLGWSKKHSLRDELLLAPGRFLWSCFWWGHGIADYPGSDLATDIRYVKLRNKLIKTKGTWKLTRQEEAALWLMARQRVALFEDALSSVATAGGLIPPRRTVFVSLLIALTSGSFAHRASLAQATEIVSCELVPGTVESMQCLVFPTGGTHEPPTDDAAVLPSQPTWDAPYIPCIGGAFILIDKRRKFRAIRMMGSRAPPVTMTGGVR